MISSAKRLAARDAAGDEAEISVDCHMHYDLVSSIELSKMLDSIGISWLEDQIPVMDLDPWQRSERKALFQFVLVKCIRLILQS